MQCLFDNIYILRCPHCSYIPAIFLLCMSIKCLTKFWFSSFQYRCLKTRSVEILPKIVITTWIRWHEKIYHANFFFLPYRPALLLITNWCVFSAGNGEIWSQQLPGFVPWCWMPVQVRVHILPRDRGDHQTGWHRAEEHHHQDDRGPVQI